MTRKRVGHLHKDYVKSVIFSQALSGLAIGLVSCPDSNEGRKLAHMRPHHDCQNHREEDLVGSQIPITPQPLIPGTKNEQLAKREKTSTRNINAWLLQCASFHLSRIDHHFVALFLLLLDSFLNQKNMKSV